MYAAFVGKREKMLKGAIDAAGKPEGGGDTNVFKALLFLRLLCVHPSLVSGGAEEDDGGEEFLDGGLKYDKLEHSGKLTALKELLFSSGIGSAIVGADNDVTAVYATSHLLPLPPSHQPTPLTLPLSHSLAGT
jgi:SNF2 family DNA or RNA helicase